MLQSDLLHILFRDAKDLVVVLESNSTVKGANPALDHLVGTPTQGREFMDLVAPGSRDIVLSRLVRVAAGDTLVIEVPHGRTDSEARVVEYRFFPIDDGRVAGIGRARDKEGGTREALGKARAELREKSRILDEIQLELTQVPFIDPVTGVWNRMQVIERLTGEWSRSERYGAPISSLLVEVEGLDALRAVDGPLLADEILKTVARRLKRVVRDHDIVGRFDGDTFVAVAVQCDGGGARSLARRILDDVSQTRCKPSRRRSALACVSAVLPTAPRALRSSRTSSAWLRVL